MREPNSLAQRILAHFFPFFLPFFPPVPLAAGLPSANGVVRLTPADDTTAAEPSAPSAAASIITTSSLSSGNPAIVRPSLLNAPTNLPTSAALSVSYFSVVPDIGSYVLSVKIAFVVGKGAASPAEVLGTSDFWLLEATLRAAAFFMAEMVLVGLRRVYFVFMRVCEECQV